MMGSGKTLHTLKINILQVLMPNESPFQSWFYFTHTLYVGLSYGYLKSAEFYDFQERNLVTDIGDKSKIIAVFYTVLAVNVH